MDQHGTRLYPSMEFTKFQQRCISLVDETTSRGRHCLRSAVDHLKKAWEIKEIDANMAVFRGITAEEEAASALMFVLKERGYQEADKLKPQDHRHKNAIMPFIEIVRMFHMQSLEQSKLILKLQIRETEGVLPSHLGLAVRVQVGGEEKDAYPIPPLNFATTINGLPPSYKVQINELGLELGTTSIMSYIKQEANLRNRILYASPDGFPVVEKLSDGFLDFRKSQVFRLMNIYLLIQPYAEIQPFVQNSLNAFLAMLGAIEGTGLNPAL